ncbi:ABC transporter ATP-binding protein [Shewanella halifaxensis]|uniref:ABC transporter ATP-binding protein n=1 Tax=Shewanella halifaxensis TaxID=271098 RepID=UPI000D5A1EDF|nr:ATP-binding cassette domain-containing protein [Shewanella halifaxensis]
MSKAILTCADVSLIYKTRTGLFSTFSHTALNNLSFTVKRGEVFGILGGNGSGKSSLLRIIAGVMPATTGVVQFAPNTQASLLSLGLGFNNTLSGRDNTILSAMLNGFSHREAKALTELVESFSELGNFYEQPVRTYSAGMRSKLGFATALYTNVDVLLIDEILSVGDQAFKSKAEQALLNIINNNEKTVIFVSHSVQQVQRICQRAIWLDKGEMKMIGDVEDVMNCYQQNLDIKG